MGMWIFFFTPHKLLFSSVIDAFFSCQASGTVWLEPFCCNLSFQQFRVIMLIYAEMFFCRHDQDMIMRWTWYFFRNCINFRFQYLFAKSCQFSSCICPEPCLSPMTFHLFRTFSSDYTLDYPLDSVWIILWMAL